MHIKQVIIQGFRSYRDQTIVEPFSPRHNVIVGRNGSGKSNFFYAIQFVLSDEYSHLRPDQRQQLIHESANQRTMVAYVEIIFDNSDNRLPIDESEVALRRQIGLKKDQYYLNRKIVTRSDVMNVLESAGFSRSNPYYIVKQGKINQMATAPDSQRLKILREVAGTRIYDERKEESRVLLRDTESKLEKIMDLLKYIEERLQTLEGEKEELREYQKWDKMRRALEYTIYNQELEDARKKKKELETRRETSSVVAEKLRENLQSYVDKIKSLGKDLREVKTKIQSLKDEKEALQHEHGTFLKEKTRLELRLKDLTDEVDGDAKSKKRAESELTNLKDKIAEKQIELNKVKPEYEEQKRIEEDCTRQLSLKEQKRSELYAKQGRGSQFTSKADRDHWIQNELKSLKRNISDKKQQIERLREDLKYDAKRKQDLENRIDELTRELENNRSSIDTQNKSYYDMKKRKDQLQNERNELWRQENSMQQNLNMLNEEKSKKDQMLRSMVGKTILNGRDSVRRVLQYLKDKGGSNAQVANAYHGQLIENFDCAKDFFTCVEMTAGNKLFHHIVENDRVGTQILQEMNRLKLPGEVTFMPINRLHAKDTRYPDNQDANPMIQVMRYDPKFDVVMKFIFGKVLICRSLEVATQLARSTNLDCITLSGDQVSHKGSLTGGYFDTRRSRLELHKTHMNLFTEIETQQRALEEHHKRLAEVESQINQVVSEMQKAETKNSKNKDTFDKMKTDIRLLRDELATIERSRQPKERSLVSHESNLHSMESLQESLRSELQQELLTHLSGDDQQEVDRLNDEIRSLTDMNKAAFSKRMQLEAQKNKLENLLNNNLCRRKDELEAALQEISVEDRRQKLESEESELKQFTHRIAHILDQVKKIDNNLEELLAKQKEIQMELERKKNDERDTIEKINEDVKDLEKISSKNSMLGKKVEEHMRKIRELGTLPGDAETKYANMSLKNLYKKLEQCNKELQKYSHVNKKALDQYLDFSEKKEKLLQRKGDLDAGHRSIVDLMTILENRKYDAIQTTFRQMSSFFTEVFKKLVPIGHGSLDMKTAAGQGGGGGDNSSSTVNGNSLAQSVDNFVGVGIRVSFTGAQAEMKDMQQLSGGQKTLVALAFILAIQKCDPAPFYLFDEVDQALDPDFRKAVAAMIHELSQEAQFITTTFRPELLAYADRFYGVKFRNRVSHIEVVSSEEAHDFVEDDTQHA